MKQNRYGQDKILQFPDKCSALAAGEVTAPLYVRIKPINVCNHDCWFCVYARDWRKGDSHSSSDAHLVSGMHEAMDLRSKIPLPKMLEILDDLAGMQVKAVTYSGGGEPLVHSEIEAILERTLELGLDLSIITNGQLLQGRRAELLGRGKWTRVSMDYANARQMAEFRHVPEAWFGKLLANLQAFAASKDPACDLGVNFIVHDRNYRDLVEVAQALRDVGVNNVRFSPVWTPEFDSYHARLRYVVGEQLKEIQGLTNDRFSVNSTYDVHFSGHKPERSYGLCYYLQVVPVIGADLRVYACHNKAYDETGVIGSLVDQRFTELWFSREAYQVWRSLDPRVSCRHQCANDAKNLLLHGLWNGPRDHFV